MSMMEWAEREIETAIKREREADGTKEGEWSYGGACYESAFKAFKSLMEDGHSGFSISMTKHILNRLIDGKPLTPITDNDEDWGEIKQYGSGLPHAQCKRMSSLFKDIRQDGSAYYHDVDRFVSVNIHNHSTWHSGLVDRIGHEMFPIPMPYMPPTKPYMVYCTDHLTDKKNGDFDTYAILYIITPEGDRVDIYRYFKSSDDESGWTEIDCDEYHERVSMAIKLMESSTEDANNEN